MEQADTPQPDVALKAYQDALRDFVDTCIAYFELDDGVTIRRDRAREFTMLFGCCVQVIRFARGYRALVAAGLHVETRVLVRAALEYAATAQFAFLRRGGLDRLNKSAQAGQVRLLERLASWSNDTALAELIDSVDVPAQGKELPDVAGIMDALDPNATLLQPAYAVLSRSTHVTSSALTEYVIYRDDIPHLNHRDPEDQFEGQTLYTLAASCMLSTWIIARVREDADMRAHLDKQSDDLGLPVRLDRQWKPQHRSFDDDGA